MAWYEYDCPACGERAVLRNVPIADRDAQMCVCAHQLVRRFAAGTIIVPEAFSTNKEDVFPTTPTQEANWRKYASAKH